MPDQQQRAFEQRMRRIERSQRRLAAGSVAAISEDGLIIAKPRPVRMRFPWRGLLAILVIVVGFKGFLHAQMGPTAYEAAVVQLQQGNVGEQIGAYILLPDPATLYLSNWLTGGA
ncbi:MAG: hypothetical protein AAFR35_00655 [Pseudomonadota bacterium]